MNLVELALKHGGRLVPITLDPAITQGRPLLNPSVTVYEEDKLLVTLRMTNFMLKPEFSKHRRRHEHEKISENAENFISENFALLYDSNLELIKYSRISLSPRDSHWHYQGLEDLRIAVWNNRIYVSGTRRDFQGDGKGRIEIYELSESHDESSWLEKSQIIPSLPQNELSHIEKNWAPISDLPFSFVRWNLPTQLVHVKEIETGVSIIEAKKSALKFDGELRGGTQVVRWDKKTYLSLVHQSIFSRTYLGVDSLEYQHRLIQWNEKMEAKKISLEPLTFMNGQVEFASGMTRFHDRLVVSFGFQDSCAYLVDMPQESVRILMNEANG